MLLNCRVMAITELSKAHNDKANGPFETNKSGKAGSNVGFFRADCKQFANFAAKFQNMSRNEQELKGVTLLGNQNTRYNYDYTPEVLEVFENKHPENEYLVTLDCPEFTSLCPKTGQPDFGHLIINYIPRTLMVESKSLKLYLFSFRNHGDFHEDCVNMIMKDLVKLMDPKYLEVIGLFNPRGGISIKPFANYGDAEHQDMVRQRLLACFHNS